MRYRFEGTLVAHQKDFDVEEHFGKELALIEFNGARAKIDKIIEIPDKSSVELAHDVLKCLAETSNNSHDTNVLLRAADLLK